MANRSYTSIPVRARWCGLHGVFWERETVARQTTPSSFPRSFHHMKIHLKINILHLPHKRTHDEHLIVAYLTSDSANDLKIIVSSTIVQDGQQPSTSGQQPSASTGKATRSKNTPKDTPIAPIAPIHKTRSTTRQTPATVPTPAPVTARKTIRRLAANVLTPALPPAATPVGRKRTRRVLPNDSVDPSGIIIPPRRGP